MANEINRLFLLNSSIKIFVLKPICYKKLSYFSEMQNDALMHSKGAAKLFNLNFHTLEVVSR